MADPEHDQRWAAVDEAVETLRDGDPEGAVRALTEVLAGDPKNEYASFFLGCALFELGRFDYAATAFAQAVRAKKDYLGARVNLAHALRMQGRLEEALVEARRAEQLEPDDGDVHYVLGLVHLARGAPSQAEPYLVRFLASNPELEVGDEVRALISVLRGEARAEAHDTLPPRLRPS